MKHLVSLYKNHAVASILMAAFVFFAVTSALSFFKSRSVHFFGKVLNVSSSQIVIADKKFGNTMFVTTEKTQVRSGRQVKANISLGQDVMVVAREIGTSSLEALEIRIFEPRL